MDWGLFLNYVALTASLGRALKSDKCGENIKIIEPGYLTSPGYPNTYHPSQKCEWLIQAPQPYQRIMINFNPHFDLEDRECKYDYVEVIDGDNANGRVWGKFCGKIAPPPVISTGPHLLIKFVSDYETHGAGFSIRYEIFKRGPECSRNFTSMSGVIRSPGFPEKYPNSLECTYIVFAPKMSEIILEFESFELEPDSNPPGGVFCRYDRLEIWDGFPEVGPHIGRYCGQNTPGRIRSSTGILSMVFYTDSAIAKEGFSANYTALQNSVSEDFQCAEPLGMESGEIHSDQISASSQYSTNWSSERSRLNYPENGWTPGEDSSREWIQVDLGLLRFVSAIGTQGAISKETKKKYFLKTYRVDISSNGEDWISVKDGNNKPLVFIGNINPTDVAYRPFPKPVLTRFVRIKPASWETGISLRFEVYGCKITDYPCSGMLGMVSGLITDSQITASNEFERNWSPENVRLITSRVGWALPPPATHSYSKEWLQIDLGEEKIVRGIIVQGGKHRENKVFMRKFKLGYSYNGSDWKWIMDASKKKAKVFEGNTNYDTPELRTFEPITTRFIRVYPERATHGGLGLRMELLGCEIEVPTSVPTTADSNLVDECDDDQANCHSGTGDDFQLTGSTTAMITERSTAIDTTVQPELPAYGFNCGFGYSSQKTICRWEHDGQLDLRWAVLTSKTGPIQDHTGDGNFIYSQADENQKGKVARLISPIINPQNSALCMTFWYHMSGHHVGTLRIKLRYQTPKEYDQVLWTLSGNQGNFWKEGRVFLHKSAKHYQVMVEGEIGKGTGGIAVDDINFDGHITQEECRRNEIVEVEPDINQTGFTPDYHGNGEPYDDISRKPGNVLKTLDPILITIIAMSSLGVLLGAICGVILYCACWHNGMSDRNLSALENYNFELVDGVKLKKDKLNAQNTYSEA
ncbi:neuropilin-1 isoform X1 [Anolis carolinensis]|uniref:neuropilin-1 isoform X1 n=1 Tax=Anolis carolinensis TaxID=28377 RepID=UPI0002039BE2|nr:PREDICTED: neuropilin-1 isoform X1 [Anolis carolinensis]|eukprot:XP_003222035.1 PREDICTED: neuropilin-1 isoform X1 [Anolis carolinensis]